MNNFCSIILLIIIISVDKYHKENMILKNHNKPQPFTSFNSKYTFPINSKS